MTSRSNLPDRVTTAPFSWARRKSKRAGFSLVEVVLAIGVVAFAFVALLGLLPTGLATFRKAMDVSVGAQIFQKIMDDARQTDFATLVDDQDTHYLTNPTGVQSIAFRTPTQPSPGLRYFDESGNEVVPPSLKLGGPDGSQLTGDQKAQVVYYVNTRIMAPTVLPANSSTSGTSQPARYLATVTVQVAANPGNIPLLFVPQGSDPNSLLYDVNNTAMKGVVVTTFTGFVNYSN